MEEKLYLYTGNRKHLARKINCKTCKKELLISKYRKHCGYCQSCNCKRLSEKVIIKDDELYIIEAGLKRRAKEIICVICDRKLNVRKSSRQKYCQKCSAKTAAKRRIGKSSIRKNLRGYRKIALEFFKEECQCCKVNKYIDIHHIDKNKKNNSLENLLPLCKRCHMKLHKKYREGKSHVFAFKELKCEVESDTIIN